MSLEPAPTRRRRWSVAAGVVLVLLAAALLWAVVPRRLGPVIVEDARVLAPDQPDGGFKPFPLATPVRLAVTFRAAGDLRVARERLGMGYVAAQLEDCAGARGVATEVVTQRAGYLSDYGRVTRLSAPRGGGARYRAVFDDALTATADHRSVRVPARRAGASLCFSLYGARMWLGSARSARVPVSFRR